MEPIPPRLLGALLGFVGIIVAGFVALVVGGHSPEATALLAFGAPTVVVILSWGGIRSKVADVAEGVSALRNGESKQNTKEAVSESLAENAPNIRRLVGRELAKHAAAQDAKEHQASRRSQGDAK